MINKLVFEPKQQTEWNNCVSACIAMITGQDVVGTSSEFNLDYHANKSQPHDYFDANGIEYRKCFACERDLKPNCVYMLIVPSLNIVGGTHAIVVQTLNDNTWFVVDPNEDREEVNYYVNDPEREKEEVYATKINSYVMEYEFESDHIRQLNNINLADVE